MMWTSTFRSTLKPILTLQKRAAQLIHKVHFLEHANVLFLKSEMMTFSDIVEFQTVQFLFKARKGMLPCQLESRFQVDTKQKIIYLVIVF